MDLKKLTNEELIHLLNKTKVASKNNRLHIKLMKEASDRFESTMKSITWIQGSGVGVIQKK